EQDAVTVAVLPEPAVITDLARPSPEPMADKDGVAGDRDVARVGARASDREVADEDVAGPEPDAVAVIAPAPDILALPVRPAPDTVAVDKPVVDAIANGRRVQVAVADEDGVAYDSHV